MKLNPEGRLKRAVQLAFIGGTVGFAAIPFGSAHAQDSGKAIELQGVQVTGSLIRRVDIENSNPITVVDRKAIEASGVTTMGQLLQQLPAVTGDALTPQVNNGGVGDGASTISLRGLGDVRTLILVDGKRIISNDVNLMPINMIERVEVLNEGAGTIYGSDAVAGVVNFITRKSFTGTEITGSTGVATDHGDGRKQSITVTEGVSSGTSHGVIGLGYDKTGAIYGRDRDVSNNSYALLYGQPYQNASSRIPTGLFTQGTSFTDANGKTCKQLTRVPGAAGDAFNTANFECRASLPVSQRTYNYQAENLVYTPTDRIHFFALGDKELTENTKVYVKGYYNHVRGHNQLASEAFDTSTLTDAQGNAINPVISQYSQYNPFGTNVTTFKLRAVDTGDRRTEAFVNNLQGTAGIKTTLLDRFDWDTSYSIGILDNAYQQYGYLNIAGLAQQLGPSQNGICYSTATGAPGSATYSNPIKGCTPINFIGTDGTRYGALSKPVTEHDFSSLQTVDSNISGDLFELPAGALSGALGFEYQYIHSEANPDSAAQSFQLSEANGLASAGGYSVREGFGELLVPILKDLPGARTLNVELGARFSSYSNFGETTNYKYGLEYRPFKDLLLRATYQDVFRAPTIGNLYGAAANDAPPINNDPCNGYPTNAAANAQYAHLSSACVNVPADGSFTGLTQGNAISKGNPDVGPEKGYTTDFGLVYSPSWYNPLTVSADFWYYSLKDAISTLDENTSLQACANTGQSIYCSRFQRGADGQIFTGLEDPENIGKFITRGVDLGLNLSYPRTRFGSFALAMNGTYLGKYSQSIEVGGFNAGSYSQAGEVSGSFVGGGYPRFKMNSSLAWSITDFEVVLRNRFISGERDDGGQDGNGNILGVDLAASGNCNGTSAQGTIQTDGGPVTCTRKAGYVDYQDVALTYKAKPIHTDFTVGMYDIFDQGAPIQYTQGPSFNYDASNYDVTGRYIYGRIRYYLK